jgi:hypothetical protein
MAAMVEQIGHASAAIRHSAHAIASPAASVTTISQSAVSKGRKNMGEIVTAPAGSVS